LFRKFVYLMALASERHFGRAAAACHVSQPTLSNAIRQLEEELQVSIVERGQKFQGFTPEGQKVLEYARRILAERDGLHQELGALTTGLTGRLRIGAIPTALPAVPHLLVPFRAKYPQIQISIMSLSSREIQRELDEFELDVGVTYLDNEPLSHVRMVPLYTERYFLLTRRGTPGFEGRTRATWAEAADLPLCQLTPDMQNRRIADTAFRMAGRTVTPAIETNSMTSLFTHVRLDLCSSIVASQLLTIMPPDPDLMALPLVSPELAYTVGLVFAERDPPAPLAQALAVIAARGEVGDAVAGFTREVLGRLGIETG
jgi:DNA-binding transcriptional LysR family regulator